MTQIQFPAPSPDEAARLRAALGSGDLTVFADGTAVRLSQQVRDGVGQILAALAAGDPVVAVAGAEALVRGKEHRDGALSPEKGDAADVSCGTSGGGHAGGGALVYTGPEFLTTSQAASAAGISLTYMRNLANAGEIPVEYRGTHRRFRGTDIAAWVEENCAKREQKNHTGQE